MANQRDNAGRQMATVTEPITSAIIAGVVLTAFGQAIAGTLVMTTTPLSVQGASDHDGAAREQGAPLEAAAPLVGPFVALGRHGDLGVGYEAVLGIAGALQIAGLAAIVAGSTIERPVEQPLAVDRRRSAGGAARLGPFVVTDRVGPFLCGPP